MLHMNTYANIHTVSFNKTMIEFGLNYQHEVNLENRKCSPKQCIMNPSEERRSFVNRWKVL